MLSYRYTLLYYCRICMRLYTYVLSLCVIYIIECRPNVRTLDRPKPNILTLYLALIYVLILTQLGGEVSTSEVSTQTAVWLRVLAWSEYVQFRPTWREYVKFKCQV